MYTDGSKVETKVASAYVVDYGTRTFFPRDVCSIFTAEIEALDTCDKALIEEKNVIL